MRATRCRRSFRDRRSISERNAAISQQQGFLSAIAHPLAGLDRAGDPCAVLVHPSVQTAVTAQGGGKRGAPRSHADKYPLSLRTKDIKRPAAIASAGVVQQERLARYE